MSILIRPLFTSHVQTEKAEFQQEIVQAIKAKDINKVKNTTIAYLNLGGDIDFQQADSSTPCMLAACEGYLEAVTFFISLKASLTKTNRYGYTVAHYAAYSSNTELIDYLLKCGVDFGQLSIDGYTPQLTARQINNRVMSAYLKQTHRLACAYSKEFISRKRIAHILEISGKTELPHPSWNRIDRTRQPLEGWHALDFWNTLAKRVKAFCDLQKESLPPGIEPEQVVELCTEAAKNKPYDQLKRYVEKKPIFLNYGYTNHHSVILLWGGFAVVCDRGLLHDSFFVFCVDPKKIDQDFIKKATDLKSSDKQTYSSTILEVFRPYLKATPVAIFPLLNTLMKIPRQTVGNCSWANSEGALYAFLVLQSVRHYATLPKEQQISIEDLIKAQETFFTEFRQFVVRHDVDKYLTRHLNKPRNTPYYPPDIEFLRRIRPKIPEDLASKVDKLLPKIEPLH